jgi:hypothetical protein
MKTKNEIVKSRLDTIHNNRMIAIQSKAMPLDKITSGIVDARSPAANITRYGRGYVRAAGAGDCGFAMSKRVYNRVGYAMGIILCENSVKRNDIR